MKRKMDYTSIIISFVIAGTKDPIDMVDGLKLPLGNTLDFTTRGKQQMFITEVTMKSTLL